MELVAALEQITSINGCLHKLPRTAEINGLVRTQRVIGRFFVASVNGIPGGLLHAPQHGHPQAHNVGSLFGGLCAIAHLVDVVKVALDGVSVFADKELVWQVNGHRMLLAEIAHVCSTLEHNFFWANL